MLNVTDPKNNAYDKKLAFKNNVLSISCISKINNTLIDNAEDLDIVIPMYNLIEYSKNDLKTIGSLWIYYRNERNSDAVGDINYSIKDSISFDYKTIITRGLEGNNTEKEVEIAIPLKYLSNFWKILHTPLINCEINLILTWSDNCVITSKATTDANPGVDPAISEINNPSNATFKVTDTTLFVPVVTLSTEDDNKLLEQLKTGFKITVKKNKYRSGMTKQIKTSNLNFLIDPTFNKVNRLFVSLFENENDHLFQDIIHQKLK